MNKTSFGKYPIRQIAYFVPDIEAAARRHAALFSSGPYYVIHSAALSLCEYRGNPVELDHSSAYGQWGEVMIEFVQQNNSAPSVFKDLYPSGQGFHHVALIVDNLEQTRREFEAAGYPTALYAEAGTDVAFAMMDTVKDYGHFVELYEPTPLVTTLYDTVKSAAVDFDGTDLIRPLS